MNSVKLLKLDIKTISRDFILILLLPVPLFLAILLRLGLQILQQFLLKWVDLIPFYPLILIFVIVLGPMLVGMVSGLMLVDEADENIIPAIAVTPLGKTGYLIHRLISPFIWTFLILLPVPLITGIADTNYFIYIPVIFTASMGSPIEALLIAVLSRNKIEAMAIGKMTGLLITAPFISWFAPAPWKFIALILPSFWTSESYFSITQNSLLFPVYIGGGIIINGIFILFLLKKYHYKIN